ncbi:MAG: Verru_Chthon cassette protein D [Prosthecobacter sp.]|nr:Verru_Chthon cassette protein D [Prosthecobacter sp.]
MKILPSLQPSPRQSRAFTRIEMLTVVGIIALLVALVTPALIDVIRSTRLNSAGDGLVNRISLAQQSAISQGTEVELRFYQYMDEEAERAGESHYYAYQVVQVPIVDGIVRPRALSDVYYIESGIINSSLLELSPLLQTTVGQAPIPGTTSSYVFTPTANNVDPSGVEYAALRFYSDGSCKMLSADDPGANAEESAMAYTIPPLNQSFITLVEARDADSPAPTNFYCVQIDSYTGKTRVYRP